MMNIRMILLGALALISACDAIEVDTLNDSQTAVSIVDELKAGSGKACSAQDVKGLVIEMLIPDYEPNDTLLSQDIEVGLNKIDTKLSLITLASADKEVGSVTCDANVVISEPGSTAREFSISYIVRPDLEDDAGFVIRGDFGSAATYIAAATSRAISAAQYDRLSAANASAIESTETDTATEGEETAVDEAANMSENEDDNVNAM